MGLDPRGFAHRIFLFPAVGKQDVIITGGKAMWTGAQSLPLPDPGVAWCGAVGGGGAAHAGHALCGEAPGLDARYAHHGRGFGVAGAARRYGCLAAAFEDAVVAGVVFEDLRERDG